MTSLRTTAPTAGCIRAGALTLGLIIGLTTPMVATAATAVTVAQQPATVTTEQNADATLDDDTVLGLDGKDDHESVEIPDGTLSDAAQEQLSATADPATQTTVAESLSEFQARAIPVARGEAADPAAVVEGIAPGVLASINRQLGYPADYPVTQADLANLKILQVNEPLGDTSSIAGLEYAINLEWFFSYDTTFTDVSPLGNLQSLRYVMLTRSATTDITPLAGLASLDSMSIDETQLASLEQVTLFPRIRVLSLIGGAYDDYSPLAQLTNLTNLTLTNSTITSVADLAPLTELTALNLTSTPLTSITPLAQLQRLYSLNLNDIGPVASDLTPLAGLQDLANIQLRGNNITDLTPLASLAQLSTVQLSDNQVTSVAPLRNSPFLSSLVIDNNQVTSLDPLSDLEWLSSLNAEGNKLTDLTALSGHNNLYSVVADNNQITSIPDLSASHFLSRLSLNHNTISSLQGIEHNDYLEYLQISHNSISDLDPLLTLTSVIALDISHNTVQSFAPLIIVAANGTLGALNVGYNPARDFGTFANYPLVSTAGLDGLEIDSIDQLDVEKAESLSALSLNDNNLTTLAGIDAAPNLSELNAANNYLTDVGPLSSLMWMSTLNLPGNSISSIAPLNGLEYLSIVDLRNNQIADLSPLETSLFMDELHVDGNRVTDLSPAGRFEYIRILTALDQAITADDLFAPAGADTFIHTSTVPVTDADGSSLNLQASTTRSSALVWNGIEADASALIATFDSPAGNFSGNISFPVNRASLTTTVPSAVPTGKRLDLQVTVTPGFIPAMYALQDGGPSWLSITPSGLVTGVPSKAGAYPVTVLVSDALGNTISHELILTVIDGGTDGTPGGETGDETEHSISQENPTGAQNEASGGLAFTGTDSTTQLGLVAALLAALGVGGVLLSRRRLR